MRKLDHVAFQSAVEKAWRRSALKYRADNGQDPGMFFQITSARDALLNTAANAKNDGNQLADLVIRRIERGFSRKVIRPNRRCL